MSTITMVPCVSGTCGVASHQAGSDAARLCASHHPGSTATARVSTAPPSSSPSSGVAPEDQRMVREFMEAWGESDAVESTYMVLSSTRDGALIAEMLNEDPELIESVIEYGMTSVDVRQAEMGIRRILFGEDDPGEVGDDRYEELNASIRAQRPLTAAAVNKMLAARPVAIVEAETFDTPVDSFNDSWNAYSTSVDSGMQLDTTKHSPLIQRMLEDNRGFARTVHEGGMESDDIYHAEMAIRRLVDPSNPGEYGEGYLRLNAGINSWSPDGIVPPSNQRKKQVRKQRSVTGVAAAAASTGVSVSAREAAAWDRDDWDPGFAAELLSGGVDRKVANSGWAEGLRSKEQFAEAQRWSDAGWDSNFAGRLISAKVSEQDANEAWEAGVQKSDAIIERVRSRG